MPRIFITGSTDGLGGAAAGVLTGDGHDVVLHARTRERAAALSDLAADAAGVVIGDLSSAAQTRELAAIELCERFGVRPLEFDGRSDALFHEYSADGRRHMEYVAERGSFADLPFEEIMRAFAACYQHIPAGAGPDRDELFDPRGEAPAPGT